MNNTIRIIAIIICVVVGLILLWKPEILWKLQYWWAASKDSSPSKYFIFVMRVIGAGFLVGAVVLLVSFFRR